MKRFLSIPTGPSWRSRLRSRRGIALVELLVGAAVGVVVLGGVYLLTYAGLLVALKSFSINSTSASARNAIDRMHLILQVAYDPPTPIDTSGRELTNGATVSPGIRFYRYIGAPYVVKVPQNGLSGRVTSIDIVYDKRAQVVPPIPQSNDALVINTTILMTGEANQVRAYVSSAKIIANPVGENPNRVTCRVTLQQQLTATDAVLPNDGTTLTATLIRPTALLVRPNGSRRELVMLEAFPRGATINMNAATAHVLSGEIEPEEGAPGRLSSATPFEMLTIDARSFVRMDLQVRDRRYHRYLESRQTSDFASYVNLETRTAFKCDPNQL